MIKKDTSNATKFHGCRAFRYEKLWFGRYKQEKKMKTQIWIWDAESVDAVIIQICEAQRFILFNLHL